MAKAERFKFTVKKLDALPKPPPGKRVRYFDTEVSGLCVEVTGSGKKTYKVYRWFQGGPLRLTIGPIEDLKIEQARDIAAEAVTDMRRGENPQEKKQSQRTELTFGKFFEEYLERHAKPHKKTWRGDENQFRLYMHSLSGRKLSAIKKRDIQALHVRIGRKAGHHAANRMLAQISVMFNKAREWGYITGENPAKGIKRYRAKSRDRFLQSEELPRFFKAVAKEKNGTIRDFILISLLTGARRGNVQAMRWEDLNLKRKTWTIPETKSGDSHTVPLVPEAVQILKERQQSAKGDWVFPGPGKSGHLVEVKTAWAQILKQAKIKDLRMHDLRRTLGSWQAAQGASLAIIGKSLAHKNVSTTLIYSRLNIDPIRESMEKATSAILQAGGIVPDVEIVEIGKAGE